MRINYNVSAMLSNNALSDNDNLLAQSLERLSSGLKLNHAKDNPAGLAMAKRMNAQIEGLHVANQNASDGVSIIETADGAMTEISEMLQRMNELSIKAATGTVSDNDRAIIQEEIAQLKEEITRISEVTEFNSQKLLNGNFSLKGYTNNIDVKVLSYSEAVATKLYGIDSITILQKEDGTYDIDQDSIALGDEFPDGAKATMKDDLIIITADNGFEMQLDISRLDFSTGTLSYDDEGTAIRSLTIPSEGLTDSNGDKVKSISLTQDENGVVSVDYVEGYPEGSTFEVDPTDNNTVIITSAAGDELARIDISGIDFNEVTTNEETGVKSITYADVPGITVDATGIGPMRLQVGANEGQILAIDIPAVNLKNMGIEDIDVSTREGALDAITRIDGAVHYVSSVRGRLGAYQNRLESTINNLDVVTENITAAYSRIMDVDMAEEMTKYTTYQVLTQAGTSMLAQANERPSQVLQLLQ